MNSPCHTKCSHGEQPEFAAFQASSKTPQSYLLRSSASWTLLPVRSFTFFSLSSAKSSSTSFTFFSKRLTVKTNHQKTVSSRTSAAVMTQGINLVEFCGRQHMTQTHWCGWRKGKLSTVSDLVWAIKAGNLTKLFTFPKDIFCLIWIILGWLLLKEIKIPAVD